MQKRVAIVKADREDVMVEVVQWLIAQALNRNEADPQVRVVKTEKEAVDYVQGDGLVFFYGYGRRTYRDIKKFAVANPRIRVRLISAVEVEISGATNTSTDPMAACLRPLHTGPFSEGPPPWEKRRW